VGSGDFETRLELRAARELTELSGALNTMAGGLKHRMHLQQALSVAEQVQNSLLPASAPAPPGLEVWGRSRYCETTGGDYYDFLDVSGIPGGRLLLAIGDVMGHGVGSALLMASARAALRSRAVDPGSVADMMARVNEVLSRDARHQKFMTMLLVVLDPQARSARWAAAGHDPPIIYEPAKQAFRTLEGGDVPLGIMTDVKYEEYEIEALTPGSVIVLGTDGIWEAQNAEKKLFGKPRLEEIIRENAGKTAAEIGAAVEEAVRAYCAPASAQDDVTMVVMRLTPWKSDGVKGVKG
jgi:sigma-B regulation protein RsbU (phosphoserine phosphatase)